MQREINKLLFSIMKGYSDSIVPPLSMFSPSSSIHNDDDDDDDDVDEEEQEQEVDDSDNTRGFNLKKRCRAIKGEEIIDKSLREREKRGKITKNFSVLQSMVPNLFFKSTRERIVSGTIQHIKALRAEIRRLELLKLSQNQSSMGSRGMVFRSESSSMEVSLSGNVTYFGIRAMVRRGLSSDIFMVFQKNSAEILAASISVGSDEVLTVNLTAIVNGLYTVENIKKDLLIL